MSTQTTSPILSPTTPTTPTSAVCRRDSGADSAPCPIVVHSCTGQGVTLTVHLTGEVDHLSTVPLRVMLASAAALGHLHLVVDTSRVTFADSALLRALDTWLRHGRTLRLENSSRSVRRLLDAAAVANGRARS
ncbi:STAS domain-containing protein [Streptomyces sp. NPDC087917]|uniref:STAS domain-containing protein n=1 Tax=Streptomyces sp. NPDC087917 TaxID=3155060 RepID=UPI00341A06E9